MPLKMGSSMGHWPGLWARPVTKLYYYHSVTRLTSILLLALGLAIGCSDDTSAPEDAGSVDAASPTDAGSSSEDAAVESDAGDTNSDAGPADAGSDHDAGSDSDAGLVDAGPGDAGSERDASTCRYIDNVFITQCMGAPAYLREWVDTGRVCEPYYTVGSARYDTFDDAVAAQECDGECLRGAGTSVTILRCGRRTGYIEYRDGEGDCPQLIETPDGLFESVAAWDEAHPCE